MIEDVGGLERSILSAVFADPANAMKVYRFLKPDDFTVDTHKDIFAACLALLHRGDMPSTDLVAHHLTKIGSKTAEPFVKYIASKVSPPANLESAVRILAEEQAFARALALMPNFHELRERGATIAELYQSMFEYARNGIEASRALRPDSQRPQPVPLEEFLAEPRQEDAWLIDNILPREAMAFLVADGGTGKTWFAVQLTLAMSAGKDILGWRIPKPLSTLVIEAEGARDPMRHRVGLAARTMGVDASQIKWAIQPPGSCIYHFGSPAFRDIVAASEADFVVCDTLRFFRPYNCDDNSSDDFMEHVTGPLKELGREFGTSFLILDHQSKDKEKKGRGTSAKRDDSDLYLRMTYTGEDTQPERVTLHMDKNRYDQIGYSLRLRLLPHQGVFMLEEPERAEDMREKAIKRSAELVADGMTTGATLSKQLSKDFKFNAQQAQEVLTLAEKMGALTLTKPEKGAGVYSLPSAQGQ